MLKAFILQKFSCVVRTYRGCIFVQVINYSESRTAEDICEQSSKLITFIDLAGHHKYLRTTIFGLTGHSPDFAMLVIAANAGIGKGGMCSINLHLSFKE